jgi:hypothetical protein
MFSWNVFTINLIFAYSFLHIFVTIFFKCLNLWIFALYFPNFFSVDAEGTQQRIFHELSSRLLPPKIHSKESSMNYLHTFFPSKFAANLQWPPNPPRPSILMPIDPTSSRCAGWSNSSCSAAAMQVCVPSSLQNFTPPKFPSKSPHKSATSWSNLCFPTFALPYC